MVSRYLFVQHCFASLDEVPDGVGELYFVSVTGFRVANGVENGGGEGVEGGDAEGARCLFGRGFLHDIHDAFAVRVNDSLSRDILRLVYADNACGSIGFVFVSQRFEEVAGVVKVVSSGDGKGFVPDDVSCLQNGVSETLSFVLNDVGQVDAEAFAGAEVVQYGVLFPPDDDGYVGDVCKLESFDDVFDDGAVSDGKQFLRHGSRVGSEPRAFSGGGDDSFHLYQHTPSAKSIRFPSTVGTSISSSRYWGQAVIMRQASDPFNASSAESA